MAKPKKKIDKKGKKKGGGRGVSPFVALGLFGVMIPFSLPTVVVLFVGMLPAMVAGYADTGRHRYAWMAVGGLNFAGVAPYLFNMWFGLHTLTEAFRILTSITPLLVMYGSAAAGWGLYITLPKVVHTFLALTQSRRLSKLRHQEKKLLEKWGDEVRRTSDDNGVEIGAELMS